MNETIKSLTDQKAAEYQTVAEARLEQLRSIEALDSFTSLDHYKVSILHLLKNNKGKMSLASLQLVHPNRVVLNEARDALEKDVKSVKEGHAVYLELINKPTGNEETTSAE